MNSALYGYRLVNIELVKLCAIKFNQNMCYSGFMVWMIDCI